MDGRYRSLRLVMAGLLVATGLILPSSTAGTHTVSALLPDLVMLQPNDFRLERKPGGVRWLRFSTIIANVGDGPFDVYGYEPTGAAITQASTLHVRQRIVASVDDFGARTWVEHDAVAADGTPSTMFYSGDGHDHWHVFELQAWRLAFEATPNDTRETGAKTGFCFWDNVDLGWSAPKEYSGTWACHVTSDGKRVPMGQAVGWGDEYPSTIAGQYIDITKYPYGNYCLTLVADPRGEFIEKSTANNTVRTLISIQTSGVTVLAQNCGEPDTTAPEAPTGLTATPGDQKVVLDWNDNSETDLAGYNVYRDDAFLTFVSSSDYTDGGLVNQIQYCYEVTAVDTSDNESSRTGPVCATPGGGGGEEPGVMTVAIGASSSSQGSTWTAAATVSVTTGDPSEPVSGATVRYHWNADATQTCTTGADGTCGQHTLSGIHRRVASVTFTVDGVTHLSHSDAGPISTAIAKP